MKSIKWLTALLLTFSALSATTGCRVGAGARVGGTTAGASAGVR